MGIVDKVMGSLSSNDHRGQHNSALHSTQSSGPEALADGRPSETVIDDRIGGTHTRNVKDAVTHENVTRHAHHEVTPIVDRTRDEVDIHQKIQPVYDEQKQTTVHEHQAPAVHRERGEDISNEHAAKYQSQSQHHDTRTVADQTHSTSVNAPKVHEHVNRHIVEEIQPVIERHTQQVEHHHTTQPITEHYTKAPRVHDTVVNEPIHISAFTGNQGGIGQSHGARDALIDDKTGHHSSHTGTGLTGSHNSTTGSGITGSHHNTSTTGTGLTGSNHNNTTSTHTDEHHKSSGGLLAKLTGK